VEKSLGSRPELGRFHLFAVDIDEIIFIRYDDASGDQFVACWPKEREFVRRGTSATTLGYPEPVTTSGPRQSDAEPALQPTDP
jgi:hypothetical protein